MSTYKLTLPMMSEFELFFFVLLDFIWIGYFIRSKRVKATFVH